MGFLPIKVCFVLTLCVVLSYAQSVPTTVPQRSQVTPPAPQKHQPDSPRASSSIDRAPRPMPGPYTGTIEGFVYWDANSVVHKPAADCSGLAITVSVGSPVNPNVMTPQQFTPLATLSNNFKYVGNVGNYAVCTYGFNHVPVGPDLQVQVSVTAPPSFSPSVMPTVAILPAKIINGQCANLSWSPAPSSVSALTAHWWTCGNYAYNVNFTLQPSARMLGSSAKGGGGMLSGTGAQSGAPRGMLTSGATPVLQPGMQSGSAPSQLMSAKPGTSTTSASGQTLTNADVVRMVKA